jgi:hypothetical protein
VFNLWRRLRNSSLQHLWFCPVAGAERGLDFMTALVSIIAMDTSRAMCLAVLSTYLKFLELNTYHLHLRNICKTLIIVKFVSYFVQRCGSGSVRIWNFLPDPELKVLAGSGLGCLKYKLTFLKIIIVLSSLRKKVCTNYGYWYGIRVNMISYKGADPVQGFVESQIRIRNFLKILIQIKKKLLRILSSWAWKNCRSDKDFW